MPLDYAFTHHLHQLMVEVAEAVAESEAKYKAELVPSASASHAKACKPRRQGHAEGSEEVDTIPKPVGLREAKSEGNSDRVRTKGEFCPGLFETVRTLTGL
jgi:hypothetical protein